MTHMNGLIVAALLAAATASSFTPPCKLPFAGKKQPIDSKCGMAGDAAAKPALDAQDLVKNNFCATGTPVVLTFEVYPGLQAAAEKLLGVDYKPPLDRSGLRNLYTWQGKTIGEGTLVSLVAFVENAHYSDVAKGESVNCNLTGDSVNDIHVPLVMTAGQDECQSVTAEISPHFRPAAWTASAVNKSKNPMRFTGQLLFDAEHHPCTKDQPENPKRQAVWEVHPVYAIDVCVNSTIAKCDPVVAKNWKALK
jgi:hypothetical protein